jgi:Mg-chelatase subunit ChlD
MSRLLPLVLVAACGGPPEASESPLPACLPWTDAAPTPVDAAPLAIDATRVQPDAALGDGGGELGGIVFLLDFSSSMIEMIPPEQSIAAVDAMRGAVIVTSARHPAAPIGLVAFRDEVIGELAVAAGNGAAIEKSLSDWQAGGRTCLALPLDRAGALLAATAGRGHIVIFLDDPPTECGGEEAARASAAALSAAGVVIHAIQVDTDRPGEVATGSFLADLSGPERFAAASSRDEIVARTEEIVAALAP